ncbi:MAG: hypothetical protein ABRQ37_12540, partial [Candidatus Eremiobacterota bacterium]
LYAQLSKTLSESKPLHEYNAQAQVRSAYYDTSIPVGSDGHFDNTVLTGSADSNVKLEVALGEDNYAEVETLPSSDTINSSDAISAAVIKSCPEKIFAFPGEIVIFKVYAEPGINLKSAGLKFTLNNSSIGCITQPVYLCMFGSHKYQVAYGCVYIKPGLDTPVDTTITARLNSGQTMSIFLEVIKKTASVSGTVYTGGMPLVKGYVKSLGPKACCKIDSSGQYSLPKVFRGHSRSVIATWWTSENGQKVRHREEKVIDFFNLDLTGFNFGVPPTPTPTLTPSVTPTPREVTDKFYDVRVSNVVYQYNKWEKEIGKEQAIQKTADWLDKKVPDVPVPGEITGASIDADNNNIMWIYFADGMSVFLDFTIYSDVSSLESQKYISNKDTSNFLNKSINSSGIITTTKSSKVLMLAPFVWQEEYWGYDLKHRVYTELADKLIGPDKDNPLYEVKKVVTRRSDIVYGPDHWDYDDPNSLVVPYIISQTGGGVSNIVTPDDYMDMHNYGVIYIATHGLQSGIYCGPFVEDDDDMTYWINHNENARWDPNHNDGKWVWAYALQKLVPNALPLDPDNLPIDPNIPNNKICNKWLFLSKNFFKGQDFSGSIIYMSACFSWDLKDTFNSADIYLGHGNKKSGFGQPSASKWSRPLAYYFFYYMMEGYKDPNDVKDYVKNPSNPVGPSRPMSVNEAYKSLDYQKVNPDPALWDDPNCRDCKLWLYQNPKQTANEIYFPAPVTIIVQKNKN